MQPQSDIHNFKAKDKGRRKIKPRIILFTIFVVIVTMGIIFKVWQLSRPKVASINQEFEYLVDNQVKNNKHIKNCLLYITRGDGSFTWSGASGIAKQENQMPMTTDTPIILASITKLYTAAAIMRLFEQGALSLDDPMSKYLPDELIRGIHVYKGHDYSHEITIAQLLSHISGIADYYSEKSKDGKTLFETFVADQTRTWTVDETIARVRNEMAPNFKPGTKASYSDTNYQLLGKIIEAVTGKPLEIVYDDFFFTPLSLKHTWLIGRSKPHVKSSGAIADVFSKDMNITLIRSNGSYWADGGMVSTVEDAVIFLKALNEGKIVSKDTLKLMHNWRQLRNMPFQYGYGIMYFKIPSFINWITKVPPVWGHMGSTGAILYYAEELDLYIAGTIDQTEDKISAIKLMIKVMKMFAHTTSQLHH